MRKGYGYYSYKGLGLLIAIAFFVINKYLIVIILISCVLIIVYFVYKELTTKKPVRKPKNESILNKPPLVILENIRKPNQSRTAKDLYRRLRGLGLNPVDEYPYSKIHMDIAFPDKKLCIEVDGVDYHIKEKDIRRDTFLKNRGWKVVRYSADMVYNQTGEVAADIKRIYNTLEYNPKDGLVATNTQQNSEDGESEEEFIYDNLMEGEYDEILEGIKKKKSTIQKGKKK